MLILEGREDSMYCSRDPSATARDGRRNRLGRVEEAARDLHSGSKTFFFPATSPEPPIFVQFGLADFLLPPIFLSARFLLRPS